MKMTLAKRPIAELIRSVQNVVCAYQTHILINGQLRSCGSVPTSWYVEKGLPKFEHLLSLGKTDRAASLDLHIY